MPRFPLTFISLHGPLFLNGNLGEKLSVQHRAGLKLSYDTELSGVVVEYQRTACLIPAASVHSMNFKMPTDIGVDFELNSPSTTMRVNSALPPTAPVQPSDLPPMSRPANPMSPPVHLRPPLPSAQVSHPVRDAVDGVKMTSAPKYLPHTQMAILQAEKLAREGGVIPCAPAPTRADLEAAGKLEPLAAAPAKRGRRAKVAQE